MKTTTLYKWLVLLAVLMGNSVLTMGSSHREAPLIANDPLADNTDVYAFRSPDDPNTVTIIANYIPAQLPQGGPNYYSFGENIRYEIHVDNNTDTAGDDIIYRFTFKKENNDPTTFFNIRLAENLKTTYTLERSVDGGETFSEVVTGGMVPPPNIGVRSITGGGPGLGAGNYEELINNAITTASTGEKVFCGQADDPFFVDLGGVFDLGDAPRQNSTPKDGLACFNVHTIAIQVPISTLQKDGKTVDQAANILDGDFVIGVWASASRQQMRTLTPGGMEYSGEWTQVSRLGMPLTNEVVIPISEKDEWNARTPYNENPDHFEYFYNPELGLYMDDSLFGGAVPAFSPLRIQRNSLGAFDFGNGKDGLFGLKGSEAVAGTALDDAVFGTLLLPAAGKPRSVDLWPIFHTGAPNFPPYQLATGKAGNPLAAGKPFINNFLPNGGDMLRLNMAVPVTDRSSTDFSTLGLVQAAVLGLVDPRFNDTTGLEFIPNMDGFPNGRRLEDDVTRIELQAVSGIVLAAIGLWYDDFTDNPLTEGLLNVLGYTTQIEANDANFKSTFPYVANPWSGDGMCGGAVVAENNPNCGVTVSEITDLNPDSPFSYKAFTLFFTGKAPFNFFVTTNNQVIARTIGVNQVNITTGPSGEFDLVVIDANGCAATFTTQDNLGELLSVTLAARTPQTGNMANGALDISVTGGTKNYTYEWSNGATTQDISGLVKGFYDVTVTDGEQTVVKSFFVLRRSQGGGRPKNVLAQDAFDMYPNPTNNYTLVKVGLQETVSNARVSVFTLGGKEVAVLFNDKMEANTMHELPFNVSGLPAGVYITKLTTNTGILQYQKLIVQ